MTLEELSDAAELGGRGNLSNIERGARRSGPRIDTLARIATALDVPLASLFVQIGANRTALLEKCRSIDASMIAAVLLFIRSLEDAELEDE